jgi:hypothetical protein
LAFYGRLFDFELRGKSGDMAFIVKRGRRTLILANDLRQWLEGLPALQPTANLMKNAPSDKARRAE